MKLADMSTTELIRVIARHEARVIELITHPRRDAMPPFWNVPASGEVISPEQASIELDARVPTRSA